MAYPTNPIYKLVKDPSTNTENVVMVTIDGVQWSIPFDDDNTKYQQYNCLLYTSPSPRDRTRSRMPSSA